MIFKSKEEAVKHAGKLYIKDGYIAILKYSDRLNDLIADWFIAEDKNKGLITVKENENGEIDKIYYCKGINLFPNEGNRVYIDELSFIIGWNKQYLNYKVEKEKCDSNNYVFDEYVTKQQLESRHEILTKISKMIFQ